MPTLTLKTNDAQGSQVLVKDLGIMIPAAGGSVTFTNQDALQEVSISRDVRDLASDDAFGEGSSTLILNDGASDIAQANVAAFLQTAQYENSGPHSLVIRDAQGSPGLNAADVDYDDTPTTLGASTLQGAVEVLSGQLGRFNDALTVTNNTLQSVSATYVDAVPSNDGLFERDSFTITASVDGTYKLEFTYTWTFNSTSSNFIARLALDNSNIYFHRQEPQNAGGVLAGTGTDQQFVTTSFRLLNLTAGSYEVSFAFGGSDLTAASVFVSHFLFFRVS